MIDYAMKSTIVTALHDVIGSVTSNLVFDRVAWSKALAGQARVGPLTNMAGSNITPESSELRVNRPVHRYLPPSDWALVEQCVGAPGWRRLLQLATADRSTDTADLDFGAIDCSSPGDGGTPLSQHNVYECSACRHHFHFTHCASFSFDNDQALTHERGLCLQATDRFSNQEQSPPPNRYASCCYREIMPGCVDEDEPGLPCRWIDVTTVDASRKPVTGPLTFQSNPDGFLCQGTPILGAQGDPTWAPTTFTTASGAPVDKPACSYYATAQGPSAWSSDDTDRYDATIPQPGQGYVTAACTHDQVGPLRNCGFAAQAQGGVACTPGAPTKVHCTTTASTPQVARACDCSAAVATGIRCTFPDALANVAVDPAAGADVTFTCPAPKDASEPGDEFAPYAASPFSDDADGAVTCM